MSSQDVQRETARENEKVPVHILRGPSPGAAARLAAEEVVQLARRALRVEAALLVHDPPTGREVVARVGLDDASARQALASTILDVDEITVVPDACARSDLVGDPLVAERQRLVAIAPILDGNRRIGMLVLLDPREPHEGLDTDLLRLCARQAAPHLAFLQSQTRAPAVDAQQALQDLTESEHRYAQILDSVRDMVVCRDNGGRVLYANEAACRFLGKRLEELRETVEPDADDENVLRTCQTLEIPDERRSRSDGEARLFHTIKTPVLDMHGNAVQVVSVSRDVTDRRHADERRRQLLLEIEQQRRRLDSIIASVPGVVWEAWGEPDIKSQRIDFVSEHVEKMLGYTREEWLATPNFWLSIVHPEDRERAAAEALAKFRAGGGVSQFRWVAKDGRVLWVRAQSIVIHDAEGAPIGMRGVTIDITDRKEAERELARVKHHLELILKSAGEGVYGVDAHGTTTFMNPAALQALGLDESEAVGRKLHSLIHHARADGSPYPVNECPIYQAAQGGASQEVHGEVFFRKDGTSFPVEYVTTPLIDQGQVMGAVTVFRDVTQRLKAEEALRAESKRNRVTLESISDAFFTLDADWRFTYLNPRAEQLLGARDGLLGRSLWDAFPEARSSTLENAYRDAVKTQQMTHVVEHFAASDTWYEVRAYPAAGGGLSVYFQDITARRKAEDAVRHQSHMLLWQRRVLERIATGAPLHETLDLLCREAEAHFPGHRFSVLLLDEDGKRLRHGAGPSLPEHYNEAIDGILVREGVGSCGTAASRREPVVVADIAADPLWSDFKDLALPIGLRACWSTPITGTHGALLGTWAIYADEPGEPTLQDEEIIAAATRLAAVAIERHLDEAELRYQRDLTRTITDNAGSALFMMDANGHPIFMNAAAAQMTGYESIGEIQDRPLHDAVHFLRPDGSPYPMEECPIDQANAEIVPLKNQRETFCRKDGTLFPVEFNVAPVTRGEERLGAVLEVRDITLQLQAEQALRERAEQLTRLALMLERSNAELDQFAYVTSHDLKAPLRGIANLSRWIEEDLGDELGEDTRRNLDLLRGRVNRMEALINAILEYSRVGRKRTQLMETDVGQLLDEVRDLLAPPETYHIVVHEGMPTLVTERMRLQQVFMNLIGNAVKHTGPTGRVEVGCEDAGRFWRFSVQDDGPGIAPRYHEKVFTIFQTLEARDKVEGTGVGLALVKKIVESQGGSIKLVSEEGKGAAFTFTWPKTPPGGSEND